VKTEKPAAGSSAKRVETTVASVSAPADMPAAPPAPAAIAAAPVEAPKPTPAVAVQQAPVPQPASAEAPRLIAPAVVLDFSAEAAANPDFLLEIDHVKQWEAANGPLPAGGWLLYRTGWDTRSNDQADFLNANETGPHTPGISIACATWLAQEAPIIGLGTETVGTDAGTAHSFDPPFPCHSFLLGAGKYGLTQLQNLSRVPATGAVVITSPLPIVGGSGSPCRALALVERS